HFRSSRRLPCRSVSPSTFQRRGSRHTTTLGNMRSRSSSRSRSPATVLPSRTRSTWYGSTRWRRPATPCRPRCAVVTGSCSAKRWRTSDSRRRCDPSFLTDSGGELDFLLIDHRCGELAHVQVVIRTAAFHQVVVGPLLHDRALLHDQ